MFFFSYENLRISIFTIDRMKTIYKHVDAFYYMTPSFWEERKLQKEFDIFIESIVHKMKVQSVEKLKHHNNNEIQRKFVDFLFEEKNEIEDDEAKDHVKAIVYGVKLQKLCSNIFELMKNLPGF